MEVDCEFSVFLATFRFLHQRHEQSKQDLKGLEETVVGRYSDRFRCPRTVTICCQLRFTPAPAPVIGPRAAHPPQSAQVFCPRPHHSRSKGKSHNSDVVNCMAQKLSFGTVTSISCSKSLVEFIIYMPGTFPLGAFPFLFCGREDERMI